MTRPNPIWRNSLKASLGLALTGTFALVTMVGCPSGGVGDPCTPEDEFRENFAGFNISEENIESRSFQCKTRVCLVNHFQGRVSCPLGQAPPEICTNEGQGCSDPDQKCVEAGVILTDCDPTPCTEAEDPENCNDGNGSNARCGGNTCDTEGSFCHCTNIQGCPDGYQCEEGTTNLCTTRVCSVGDRAADPTHCYVPGTNIPVAVEVCSQCTSESRRHAEDAVYCSCRCGAPDTNASDSDENFNFCECPEGFSCEEIRPNVGLGDPLLAGKYCIKEGTEYINETSCTQVQGYSNSRICQGVALAP